MGGASTEAAGPGAAGTSCDVVVLGAGIVGATCAWRAAAAGADVVLVDPAPGSGASRAAAGMLAAVTELHHGEEDLLRLSLRAAAGFAAHAAEVAAASGLPSGYRASGTLAVARTVDDRARLADVRAAQQRLGLDVTALSGRECRRLEPFLDPSVAGGTLVPGDHQVDPRLLLPAVLAAGRAAGVRHVAAAGEPLLRDGRAVGATTGDGVVRAGAVVLSQGARGAAHAPVRPVKGQVLRLRTPPGEPLLRHVVRGRVDDREVYLVPRADGGLVVGATTEERGFDTATTAGAVLDLLDDARRLLPGVVECELLEASAASRPASPDGVPLLGRGDVAGLLLATGHGRNGVLLSRVTADAVVDLLAGREPPADVAPCVPGRVAQDGPTERGAA